MNMALQLDYLDRTSQEDRVALLNRSVLNNVH